MIAEPYICIKGQEAGAIEWFQTNKDNTRWEGTLGPCWMRYSDFEREKLKELEVSLCIRRGHTNSGYCVYRFDGTPAHGSLDLIGYSEGHYDNDSESSRLLKRAEFLRAVCEREGVKWLPAAYDRTKVCHCSCPEDGDCVECRHEKPAPHDTYTKAEVDERLAAVLDVFKYVDHTPLGCIDHVTPMIQKFRHRFLS